MKDIAAEVYTDSERMAAELAERIRDAAADLHATAPRGGRNRNRFGEQRSAPGEPPATEEGDLLEAIMSQTREGMRVGPGEYHVIANRAELETGTRTIAPRPLARLAVEAVEQGEY